jgi:hypothetical protein
MRHVAVRDVNRWSHFSPPLRNDSHPFCHTEPVIWFFERAGAEMRVVTRFDQTTCAYVVEVERPDRDRTIERYVNYDAFQQRVQRLHTELRESLWTQDGAPAFISDGWRGPTSSS